MTIREEYFTHGVTKERRKRWRVTYTVAGKTRRKYLGSLREAEAFAKSVEKEARQQGTMLASMSEAAKAEMAAAYNRAIEGGFRLADALDHFERHLAEVVTNTVSVGDAVAQYLSDSIRRGLKDRSVNTLRQCLESFAVCHSMNVDAVTAAHVQEWIDAHPNWSPQTVNHAVTKIGSLFRWCEDRGYCRSVPVKRSMKRRVERPAPCVMPVDDVRRLLKVAYDEDEGIALLIAVQLFAGLRPAEAETEGRSGIEMVHLETNELAVRGKVERQRRLVTISDNLRAWLERIPGGWAQTNVRRRLERVRELAGVTWGHDILRHSFASYHLAAHENAAKTAHEMGHAGNSDVLYTHYRAVVRKGDADEFWKILPPSN